MTITQRHPDRSWQQTPSADRGNWARGSKWIPKNMGSLNKALAKIVCPKRNEPIFSCSQGSLWVTTRSSLPVGKLPIGLHGRSTNISLTDVPSRSVIADSDFSSRALTIRLSGANPNQCAECDPKGRSHYVTQLSESSYATHSAAPVPQRKPARTERPAAMQVTQLK